MTTYEEQTIITNGMRGIARHGREHTYKDYTIDQYTTLLVDFANNEKSSLMQKLDASVTDIDYSAATWIVILERLDARFYHF